MTKTKQVKYFEETLRSIVKSKHKERDIRLFSLSVIKIVDKDSEIAREIIEAIIYACLETGTLSVRSIKEYFDIHIADLHKAFMYIQGAEKICKRLDKQSDVFIINKQFVGLKDSLHFLY